LRQLRGSSAEIGASASITRAGGKQATA